MFDFLFRRRVNFRPETPESLENSLREMRRERCTRREIEWKKFLDELTYPFELLSAAHAQAALEKSQLEGHAGGFCPLLVLPGFDGKICEKPFEESASLDEILKGLLPENYVVTPMGPDGETQMAQEYFKRRAADLAVGVDLGIFDNVPEVSYGGQPAQLNLADWQCGTTPSSLYSEVALVRLPCEMSWQIPRSLAHYGAPLDQGGTLLEEELAIEKEWYERFGAELCCVGYRSWQFRVARPPRFHHEAVELFRQRHLYSYEWFDGRYNREHIENGAAALRIDTYWQHGWV